MITVDHISFQVIYTGNKIELLRQKHNLADKILCSQNVTVMCRFDTVAN
jgi:hypothetical protein